MKFQGLSAERLLSTSMAYRVPQNMGILAEASSSHPGSTHPPGSDEGTRQSVVSPDLGDSAYG